MSSEPLLPPTGHAGKSDVAPISSSPAPLHSAAATTAPEPLDMDTRRGHVATLDTSAGCCFVGTSPLATALCVLAFPFTLLGMPVTVPPRHAVVGTVFGRYVGTWTSGCWCINPCGLQLYPVSVNNRAHELQAIKVADAVGNTVLVSGVVTYRVVDAAKAALDIENLSDYVRVQAHATLKRVASRFPYISYDGAPSLVTEAAQLAERLRGELQAALRCAGVHVVSFQLSDLAYAPEIAQAMLVRQQAQAVLDARRTIVAGAVGIVADALRALEAQGAGVGDGDAQPARARLVTNLLTVLCSERGAQPVLDC